MSVSALIQGTIVFGDPQQRVSRNGKNFVIFKMKAANGSDSHVLTVFVFSESQQAELLRLHEGDALACQGTLKFEIYRPEGGEPRVSLSLMADHMLALRQPPKERKKKEPSPTPVAAPPAQRAPDRDGFRARCGSSADLDDSIPF